MAFRFRANLRELTGTEIGALRTVCGLSIGELRRRAAAGLPLIEIPVFAGEWPASKPRVIALLDGIERGALPLAAFVVEETSGGEREEAVSVAQARDRLRHYLEIALEQDMHAQLESGHIASPGDYVPPGENEA
jgi:hypothetical protein